MRDLNSITDQLSDFVFDESNLTEQAREFIGEVPLGAPTQFNVWLTGQGFTAVVDTPDGSVTYHVGAASVTNNEFVGTIEVNTMGNIDRTSLPADELFNNISALMS